MKKFLKISLAFLLGLFFLFISTIFVLNGALLYRRNAAFSHIREKMASLEVSSQNGAQVGSGALSIPEPGPSPTFGELGKSLGIWRDTYRESWVTLQNDLFQREPSEWTETEWQSVEAVLSTHQAILDRVRSLAAVPGTYIPPDTLTNRIYDFAGPTHWTLTLSTLLWLETDLHIRNGDLEFVLKNVAAQLWLHALVSQERSIAANNIATSCVLSACTSVQSAFPPGTLNLTQATEIATALHRVQSKNYFVESLAADALRTEALWEDYRTGKKPWPHYLEQKWKKRYESPFGGLFAGFEIAATTDYLADLVDASAIPIYQADPILETIFAELRANRTKETWPQPRYNPITNVEVRKYAMSLRGEAAFQVQTTLTRTGLLLEGYWTEHGTYPLSLDAIVPYMDAAPIDPYSGESLVYQPNGDSFLLYSVGFDRTGGYGVLPVPYGRDTWRGEAPQAQGEN